MRVPIEAQLDAHTTPAAGVHHPLKMRVPIEAKYALPVGTQMLSASPSENEGPY